MARKKIQFGLVIIFLFVLYTYCQSCAEEEYRKVGSVLVPEGMDTLKRGDVNVLVPKGGRIYNQSSFAVGETPDEYSARKFMDNERHFAELEKKIEEQEVQINDLKKVIEKMLQNKDKGQNKGKEKQ